MPFTIKNILTEDEARITHKMRDTGAYDWTRKRKAGEEDYSLSMPKVKKAIEEGLTRDQIADKLCKRKQQIIYIEELLTARFENPRHTKTVQAERNIARLTKVMSKWKFLNKDPKEMKSFDFAKLRKGIEELERQSLIKEGKVA